MASDDNLQLPDDIKVIINCDSFWDSFAMLRDLLYSFCIALNFMQQNKAHLYHILHSFAFFMQVFKNLESSQFQTKMITRLEKRWNT